MTRLDPYLNFPGTTEEAFILYKSVFGGEFAALHRFKDMPATENKVPEAYLEKIMHISLNIGNAILMGTDAIEEMGQKVNFGNNAYISITADSRAEADRIFSALSAGGKVEMPMTDMFWGDYFGSFTDKFGAQWMVAFSNRDTH